VSDRWKVRATKWEAWLGAMIGAARRIESLMGGLEDQHGFSGDPWGANIEGAIGELMAAKGLGRYWDATVNAFKAPDVGPYQVRTMKDLIIRPGDKPHEVFIWVTGACPDYELRGWIWGREARRDEWLKGWGPKPKAWFVPPPLHRMEDLPSEEEAYAAAAAAKAGKVDA